MCDLIFATRFQSFFFDFDQKLKGFHPVMETYSHDTATAFDHRTLKIHSKNNCDCLVAIKSGSVLIYFDNFCSLFLSFLLQQTKCFTRTTYLQLLRIVLHCSYLGHFYANFVRAFCCTTRF